MSKPALPPRRSGTLDAGDLDDEPPPEYSRVANQYEGEQVMEAGPSRPFQEAPVIHQQPSMDVGQGRPYVGVNSSFPPQPPVHSQQNWSPPPGSPRRDASRQSAPARKRYEPSTRPIPGQPLLHDGKLLVFPPGKSHTACTKCHDTGYKAYDTSHPCSSCWKKYGKPFTSALRISLSAGDDDDGVPAGVQKPLPETRVPPRPADPPMQQQSYGSYQQPYQPPPPNIVPIQQPSYGYGPWGAYQPYGGYQQMPPPNAVVYTAGDPRIGGQRCYRCGGDGWVSGGLFMLGEETCPACRGTGRVF